MGDLDIPFRFIYVFDHLSISESTYGYVFLTLGYNPILLYLFCCPNRSTKFLLEDNATCSFVIIRNTKATSVPIKCCIKLFFK